MERYPWSASAYPPRRSGEDIGHLPSGGLVHNRRRQKILRFVVCEVLAVAFLAGSVIAAGFLAHFTDTSLGKLFRILPIAAALAATLLPIVFFGSSNRRR